MYDVKSIEVVPVDLANPTALVPAVERAIAGGSALLPVPAHDRARTEILRNAMRINDPIDDEISVIMSTSGSTGTPKGAQLTAANLISSADATHQHLGGPGQWLLALPAHHIAGLQVITRNLVAGVEPLALDLSAGFDVDAFLTASRELKETGDRIYTSISPMQLTKALERVTGIEALRLYDAILVGGAAVHPKDLEACSKLGISVVTSYGSSETAGGCVYDGRALPGAQVRVQDGRIYLGGPMIAHGYRNHPDHEAFAEEGWFATTDCGVLDNDLLTITGRLDSVIITGGLKLHPEVLERELTTIAGVDSACVVGVPHPRFGQAVCAVYEGSAEVDEVFDALDHLPRWQLPKDLRRLAEIPRIGPGKVDRTGVEKLFNPRAD
ncbi:o-succinylbenzoate--CoA ligase [Corynebacterium tapiri]|uniref:O-succinylbenzoate--CoA ligase n=1 Tax=Corynebacterium tapiri TaxID=1448266 RepID=A0A5C4U3Y2_9CORY|nr:o-succinylbenzoate--CoA ligase [Corynebacterium tapiri]TNL97280.1 o-succinylbenzoate--CoA ligase [Corynebacterium tapiri]